MNVVSSMAWEQFDDLHYNILFLILFEFAPVKAIQVADRFLHKWRMFSCKEVNCVLPSAFAMELVDRTDLYYKTQPS